MKIALFRKITDTFLDRRLTVTLKGGKTITGAWFWLNGPGEIIAVSYDDPNLFNNTLTTFIEVEEIAAITLNREEAKS